ncbi:Similar to FAM76A: Protein FAM76A (Homo sapiens) [Cotesia congregata]|uniref:Similar to FAM76A: Protein FAM76A (Homo sapiens) n=1 Tax=Cotesia congregata TaxID=51543 RepID=A0A8J2HQW4_COTCN|nr:Similar to FAM76A: Protein FAM76A (Homo sapiens) [Cotesia congregata]
MSSNNAKALFACSRCFGRHPFEELSPGQQLCKECRGSYPVVKCTYCRSEFQQTVKGNTCTICKKCEQNVKAYGKPSACEYCNTIAAFIGSKCQRCTNSEKRYGPPVTCEQCKQKLKGHNKRPHRVDVTKLPPQPEPAEVNGPTPLKVARMVGVHDPHDPNSSDHVVAVTQLKEKIAHLQKQLSQKDNQLLTKDRQITDLKAKNFTSETELRNKMKLTEKEYESKVATMQSKISTLLKEVATLSKSTKRADRLAATKNEASTNSGSGTDSPIP